ncbi:hypothetical protein CYMTET_23292 [Cymbomonas tetramitiformis]|uniref:CRAL-TRIO domain-containing protein n=1 Tax=Cymbomonas tetramitiformis TaxID=36881 RepID=A0AAE0FY79_9CHLO|nr:hypothetical protein CYMTET_23292 [Cymbomonas tetramitiformis]
MPSSNVFSSDTLLIDMDEKEERSVQELRALLTKRCDLSKAAAAFCTQHTLLRFYKAQRGDLVKACESLTQTLEWRKDNVDGRVLQCPTCKVKPGSHSFQRVGSDLLNRPVIYGSPARASDPTVKPTVDHVVYALEEAFGKGGGGPGQWVWIVDLNGFQLKHALNIQLGLQFASIFTKHYPERLGIMLLINPPLVFDILWKVPGPPPGIE